MRFDNTFLLESGREIYLQEIFVKSTFEGVLEGDPIFISAHLLDLLPKEIERVMWASDATLILKPDGNVLPSYTFIAHLESLDPVPSVGAEEAHYSRLIVCWFQEYLGDSLLGTVEQAVRSINWNQHAENWQC